MKGLRGVRSANRRAGQVALIYAGIAALWIGFSDRFADLWTSDPATLTHLQTAKGWGFVIVSAAVLFVLLQRLLRDDERLLRRYERQRRKLCELSQFRESVIDNASVWINVLDTESRVMVWNKAAEQISGYSRHEVLNSTRVWEWLYPDPDYRARVTGKAAEILSQGTEVDDFETLIRTKTGEVRNIAWHSRRFFGEHGEVVGSVAMGRDVTESKRVERALIAREQELATLLSNLPGMAYRCLNDRPWTMKFVSSGCFELTGYSPDAMIDNHRLAFADLIHPDDRERVWEDTQRALARDEAFAHEYRLTTRTGEEIWVWEQGRAVDRSGELLLEGIIMDITDRKQLEHELSTLARSDPLTTLPNRREFYRLLVEELERANRYERPLSLLWLDLDDFKVVNDRFGHLAGDEVLRRVAALLRESIRSVDHVCRIGGEEFVIILPEMALAEAVDTGERLRHLVRETRIDLDCGERVGNTVSIGVAAFPEHGVTVDALSGAADHAMYDAKNTGRDQVRIAGGMAQDLPR